MKTTMTKQLFLFLILLMIGLQVIAQQEFRYKTIETSQQGTPERNKFDLGLGMGIEYGGFLGAQLEYVAIPRLGVFLSGGYYLVGAGWEMGLKGYIMPKLKAKPFRVYVTGMYGTNAAIFVIGASDLNRIYQGPTFGAGLEMRFGREKKSGLNVALLYPVRALQYEDDVESLKHDPRIDNFQEPFPVGISIAYHHEF